MKIRPSVLRGSARSTSRIGRSSDADSGSNASLNSAADSGSATAEIAIALPAIMLLIMMILLGGSAAAGTSRCTDAATAAVRLVSAGESADVVSNAVQQLAGAGASHSVSRNGEWVSVRVQVGVGSVGSLPGFLIHAEATTRFEDP